MARTDLRFTYIAKGRYWRFRHKAVGDVALPHARGVHVQLQPQQPGFMARYSELLDAAERREKILPPARGTFAWLVAQYRLSAEFRELADRTQADYDGTLNLIVEELGEARFEHATRNMLKAVRDGHADKVRKAHKIKQMLSRLYSWADEAELVPAGFNPAKSIKRLKRKGGDREIVVWSDAEIDMFLAAAPAHVVTPVLLALFTGQRRRDVALMVWTQYQGGTIRVRQSKTQALLDVACHPRLRAHLDALPRRAAVIATTAAGKAYNEMSLSQTILRQVRKTDGMPINRSMHGLRYAAGSRMEEAGCTVAEIESVLGHETFKMALKYASQRLRAKAALEKLEAAEVA